MRLRNNRKNKVLFSASLSVYAIFVDIPANVFVPYLEVSSRWLIKTETDAVATQTCDFPVDANARRHLATRLHFFFAPKTTFPSVPKNRTLSFSSATARRNRVSFFTRKESMVQSRTRGRHDRALFRPVARRAQLRYSFFLVTLASGGFGGRRTEIPFVKKSRRGAEVLVVRGVPGV